MIPRYSHPVVTELWSDEWAYSMWLAIERRVLAAQRATGVVSREDTEVLVPWLAKVWVSDRAAGEIRAIERTTNHDVVAFLTWLREGAPDNTGRWIHFGLTSSDLVDTAMGVRFQVLRDALMPELQRLMQTIGVWATNDTPLVGRTHGQVAEPTSMRVRAEHWRGTLAPAFSALLMATNDMQTAKMSGPVGTFAHNPLDVEMRVAQDLGLVPQGAGASQIVPRSSLALWAAACGVFAAACAKIAMDTRLMDLLGEAHEGKQPGEVGSSAMAQKRNPIIAEQIKGMAQMVNGYASMLQPLDLWLERDISHSCVERVAVPDLWHLILRITSQTTKLLQGLEFGVRVTEGYDLDENCNAAWVHKTTLEEIEGGMNVEDARAQAMGAQKESYDTKGDAAWFTRNYPRG